MIDPVDNSRAEAGEIADAPEEGDISCYTLKQPDGTVKGYLINWSTSVGANIIAGRDSFVSLDEMM
jgi:hypothetical protein